MKFLSCQLFQVEVVKVIDPKPKAKTPKVKSPVVKMKPVKKSKGEIYSRNHGPRYNTVYFYHVVAQLFAEMEAA